MKNQKNTNGDKENGGNGTLIAAVAGAVVGAGIAVAGVVLSDEKNREKVGAVATDAKDSALNTMSAIKEKIDEKTAETEKKLKEDREKVEKVVSNAKHSIDKTAKAVNNAIKSL